MPRTSSTSSRGACRPACRPPSARQAAGRRTSGVWKTCGFSRPSVPPGRTARPAPGASRRRRRAGRAASRRACRRRRRRARRASCGREAVAELGQHVVEVVVVHLLDRADQQARATAVGQPDGSLRGGRRSIQAAERVERRRLSRPARGQPLLVLLDGDRDRHAVDRGQDAPAGVGDADVDALDRDGRLGRLARRPVPARAGLARPGSPGCRKSSRRGASRRCSRRRGTSACPCGGSIRVPRPIIW